MFSVRIIASPVPLQPFFVIVVMDPQVIAIFQRADYRLPEDKTPVVEVE